MSFSLRIVLLASAIVLFVFIRRKLRKNQLKLTEAFFWIMFSVTALILGLIPEIGIFFSELLGFISASNFIFFSIISLLVVKSFLLTIKVSKLEDRLVSLTQELSIRENEERQNNAERF